MDRSLVALIVSGALAVPMVASIANSEQTRDSPLLLASESAPERRSALPAVAPGKNTIIGGEIRNLDTVRDQFQLKAFGQRPMTVQFDERTEVFLDGKKIHLRDLPTNGHASVQTVLDGAKIFAVSIHLLSHPSEGEYQGQVRSYNSGTRELSVIAAASHTPMKVLVPQNTPINRVGQGDLSSGHSGESDLVKGTLVSLTFEPDKKGGGIAKEIAILAAPGSACVLSGSLSSLDVHSGRLVLVDSRDQKSYQVSFDPARLAATETLREGDRVVVNATFDGSSYVADGIDVN